VELLRNLSKPVVFTEPQLTSGTRYVQALAREVGAQVYVLYSDSLTSEVSTYVEMMEYNLQVLLEALR
jgi:zinc/manganese transport system substrate-binding protein/zinc transport system substrate-binding protein